MKCFLKWLFAAGVMVALLLGSGCTTSTLTYPSTFDSSVKGRSGLRVGVCEFTDRTGRDHSMHWDKGNIHYTNLGSVSTDATVDTLRSLGFFGAVERVGKPYSKMSAAEKLSYDVLVAGEVLVFKSGEYPHPTTFINPISLGGFFGIPSCYVLMEGECNFKVTFFSSQGGFVIEGFSLANKFGPEHGWGSVYGNAEQKGVGNELLRLYGDQLDNKIRSRLLQGLDQKFTSLSKPRHQSEPVSQPVIANYSKGINGKRWAVVVGVSKYKDSRIPALRYASSDAQAYYDWLVSPSGGKYAPSRVKLLTNEQATGSAVKDALFDWLKQALKEDMVTIYFAGHGSPESPDSPNNLFLLTYDSKYDSIASTGFPMWDIETALKRFIKAEKVVVLADACHAGGVGQSFDIARRSNRGMEVNPISSGLSDLSKASPGVAIFSASADNQYSQESQDWGGGHGVFTYYLLKGLQGEGDFNGDGTVNLGELNLYLSEQVRRATKNAQSPIVSGKFDPALTIGN